MRGTQKSILERKAPATFPTLVEMRQRNHWVAHNVEARSFPLRPTHLLLCCFPCLPCCCRYSPVQLVV